MLSQKTKAERPAGVAEAVKSRRQLHPMCAQGARQSEQVQASTVSAHYVPMETGSQHDLMKENHTFADDGESLASGNTGRAILAVLANRETSHLMACRLSTNATSRAFHTHLSSLHHTRTKPWTGCTVAPGLQRIEHQETSSLKTRES